MKKNLFNNQLPKPLSEDKSSSFRHRQSSTDIWLWSTSAILCLVFIFVLSRLIILWNQTPTPVKQINRQVKSNNNETVLTLPTTADVSVSEMVKDDPNFRADQLIFKQIYQAPTTSWPVAVLANQSQIVDLPTNIKKDIINYYEIRRHYNLEPVVNQLNQQGSVLVDNPFGTTEQDFFDFYDSAQQAGWPLLLTNDVIFYYYQNNIKEVYKAVEAGFYDSLWQISNGLFEAANQRYRAAISQIDQKNNPILEAYRLNAQYWAVAIKLLVPKTNQINKDGLVSNSIVFRSGDDQVYKMPQLDSNLSREVDQEVALIQAAASQKSSPIFGHEIDYALFAPDNNYQVGGRLTNFSIASRWLSYTWPTYSQEIDCPDCQLDIDDWRVNFLAANVLARDLASNQEFKNHWAKIYKTINYFSGLRDELTYVHYFKAQQEVLGDQTLEERVSSGENERNEFLDQLQRVILKNNFSTADGGWNRQLAQDRAKIGLRALQDNYWPGQKIDWSKISSSLDSFIDQQQVEDWQTNQFWSSLEMIGEWFAKILPNHPDWFKPTWWKNQQLALAKFYLINWQLPADQRGVALPKNALSQDSSSGDSLVSIDTNGLSMIDRQIAEAKMLRLAFAKLQASNLLSEQKLTETINVLQMIKDLAVKQSAGQAWTKEESDQINNFFQSRILQSGDKKLPKADKKDFSLQKIMARIELRKINDQPHILIGPVIEP